MAIFELTEASRVAVAWFLPLHDGDLFTMVYRDHDTAPWQCVTRFRLRRDGRIGVTSDDRKSVYRVSGDATDTARDDFVAAMDQTLAKMQQFSKRPLQRLEIYGTAKAFYTELSKHPFAHTFVPVPGPERPQ